jgi:hypothetical protein
VQWKFNRGVPFSYCLLGRKLFGKTIKYPLLRLEHFRGRLRRNKLCFTFGERRTPRYRVPEQIQIRADREASLPVFQPRDSEAIHFDV